MAIASPDHFMPLWLLMPVKQAKRCALKSHLLFPFLPIKRDRNLNIVRARVNLAAYDEPDYPAEYSTPDEAIEHERGVELSFEFHRFFDLVRTGQALEVMQAKGYDINQNKLHFPVPQRAIDVNPKLTQNDGY